MQKEEEIMYESSSRLRPKQPRQVDARTIQLSQAMIQNLSFSSKLKELRRVQERSGTTRANASVCEQRHPERCPRLQSTCHFAKLLVDSKIQSSAREQKNHPPKTTATDRIQNEESKMHKSPSKLRPKRPRQVDAKDLRKRFRVFQFRRS